MLRFDHVALRRGPDLLFEHATFAIHTGWKVGLTGANGTGKSSLFALIRGELHADAGTFTLPEGWVIAHVAQEMPAGECHALDHVLDGDEEFRALQRELEAAEEAGDGARLAELHERFAAIDGWGAAARAGRLLAGLGFAPEELERPVASFSGGWRMRLNLARALMCRSDLLLLDEPTNHLDIDSLLWLEEWLRRYPGTLLLISHDREFLDRVIDRVLHIEHRSIRLYTGNHSDFERQRAERLASRQAAWERQQREVEQIRRFVDRFRAKATKARQAQSRLKALERMERIAPAHADSPFHFAFRTPERLPDPLLQMEEVTLGYGERPVIEGVRLSLAPGDRLGLLGANGAGKSTLVRALAGELEPGTGRLFRHRDLRIGYFAQHQLEQLDAEASPLRHLLRIDPGAREQELRDFLGGFGFRGERVEAPVAPFSGGEKARLVLALLVWQRPNLLLLDEPTNHLDLEMRLSLSLALQSFEGAMVIVAHDRHLLRTVCDRFLVVRGGKVTPFDGDLDDYRVTVSRGDGQVPAPVTEKGNAESASRREQRRRAAEQRRRRQPLRRRVDELEAELDRLGEMLERIGRELSEEELYREEAKERLRKLLREQGELRQRKEELETAWLEAVEALEASSPQER
ncbi:MAG TPA: ATP-binding cassette domain-containing protein [Thiotrichales bacterium]|nr:ATP-binding cassette domain-containing protein [Thiotrichales bacterium]